MNTTSYERVIFAGSGLGAVGAMIWSRYFRDSYLGQQKIDFRLMVEGIPNSYLWFKTGNNEYELALQNMMKLANTDQGHPFTLCKLRNEGRE